MVLSKGRKSRFLVANSPRNDKSLDGVDKTRTLELAGCGTRVASTKT